MQTIEKDFYFEKVNKNGNYIKVQKSNGIPFKNTELQDLQRKMLESNAFPAVLPIHFEELNDECTLFYKIDGLKSIRNYLKENSFTMESYYSFFIKLLNALEESSNNMLDEASFVLEEDYIFVNNNLQTLKLVYLPVKVENPANNEEKLKQLLLHLASEVIGLDGKRFKLILNYIKDSSFSLQGVKQLLISLHQEIEETEEETEEVQVKQKQKKPKEPLKQLNSKYKLYSVLFGLLLAAVVWNLLGESSTGIIIASVISVLIIGILLFINLKGIPNMKQFSLKRDKEKKAAKPSKTKGEKQAKAKKKEPVHSPESMTAEEPNTTKDFNFAEEIAFNSSANKLDEIALNNENNVEQETEKAAFYNDQTILLDYENDSEIQLAPTTKNYLINQNDELTEIELVNETIVIGRAEKGTEISTKSAGVSRFHAELIKLSDTYGIKDLGSKNGTFLNGEKIIPYKIHELNHEDSILIGKETYVYKVEI
ncbi:DUF6382 domain-containing protein [Ornithinibacillus sp. 4-3]|uniref:DUF6382 domain-containing protein n=1 Tax=Ornithinibacillus sp. 4-3 TaxID=3231488 RepID=A0AB39HK18_9BACI